MARKRLRPMPTSEELARIYVAPHDHRRWTDHHLRVNVTIEVARWMVSLLGVDELDSIADLSCGNAAIANAIPAMARVLGDFAPGYEYTGPIEQTIEKIPQVELFVHSETLEHVDDPDLVLRAIRQKTRGLVLSTPVNAWEDSNVEHVWAWGRKDVEEMLAEAGFDNIMAYTCVDFRQAGLPYAFGIWGCA